MLASIAAGLLGDLVWLPALLKRFPWLLIEGMGAQLSGRWKTAGRYAPYAILLILAIMAFFPAHQDADFSQAHAATFSVVEWVKYLLPHQPFQGLRFGVFR